MSNFNATETRDTLLGSFDSADQYATIQTLDSLNLGWEDLKRLDFNVLHQVIGGVAQHVPHLEDPLSDIAYTELLAYYRQTDTNIGDEGLPYFLNVASVLATNYVEPSIVAGVQSTDPNLTRLSVLVQHRTNSEATGPGSGEDADNLVLMGDFSLVAAQQHLGRRVIGAVFGAAHSVLAERLYDTSLTAVDQFSQNFNSLQAVLGSREFATRTLSVAAQSLSNFNKGHENWLTDDAGQVEVDPENFDSIPVGCPAGRLIVWAPRLLFTAARVVVDER